jgi:3-keto steroid reductase
MGLPPWETSDSQLFALVTGANRYEPHPCPLEDAEDLFMGCLSLDEYLSINISASSLLGNNAEIQFLTSNSGLGFAIAGRLIDEFLSSPSTPPNKHLVLILCTRSPIKSRYTISRLRAHLRVLIDSPAYSREPRKKAKAEGREYKWEDIVERVHFLGVQADLCDLQSVYALADQLVNGTVGSPDATRMDGGKLPHGSPGTQSYSEGIRQDSSALSQKPGSSGYQRSWGWGLSGIRLPRLDVIALNAGIGGWTGVSWFRAVGDILWDVVDATTWPRFKLSTVGAVVKAQLPSEDEKSGSGEQHEPPLGQVFCSNVFGHYILAHELMPLLSRPASADSRTGGKIIWISSIEAVSDVFSIDDIQGLQSPRPYESTKRLTDVLSLTSDLPSVTRISAPFYDSTRTVTAPAKSSGALVKPKMYTTHPGVFTSDIMPLPAVLMLFWGYVALVARWFGSPWHPADPYKAAVAPVWAALAEPELLEDMGGTSAKWGSATDFWGAERVMKTEVDGWGWDGKVGAVVEGERRKGRHKHAVDLTDESRVEFEVLGGQCWKQMEELRKEWEGLLKPIVGKK